MLKVSISVLRIPLSTPMVRSAPRIKFILSGREVRFAKDVNHSITKKFVAKAKDTIKTIALERLTGISRRGTVTRRRATLTSWSLNQFRSFIESSRQASR